MHGVTIRINRKKITISMHREVLGLKKGDGKIGDHKNRNGLDNRKQNLRIVPKSLNNYNSKKHRNNTSGYRGVSKHNDRSKNKYAAVINVHCVRKELGRFQTACDAALAYDEAAKKHWGADAILNFPEAI